MTLIDIFIISITFELPIIIFSSNNIPSLYCKTKVFGKMDVNDFYLIKIKRVNKEGFPPQLGILKYKNKIKINIGKMQKQNTNSTRSPITSGQKYTYS